MSIQLRPPQVDLTNQVYAAWAAGAQNVLMQSGTGTGKTVMFSDIVRCHQGKSLVAVHRSEILGQISLTLARCGVRHRIVASEKTKRSIINSHVSELGQNFTSPHAEVFIASVDTLVLMDPNTPWFKLITLVVQDEAHHVLRENKWGIVASFFPNARGLYPTATPLRGDGKGLGRHADGIIDVMVVGEPMRKQIEDGYLCDYTIHCPDTDVDYSDVNITASGELSMPKLSAAVHKSKRIVGDVVAAYKQFAAGKTGITFAVDIEAALELAAAYNAAGVPAEVVTSKTDEIVRVAIMRKFRAGKLLQLVSVDILGEGVDVPAVEVVSFVRKTASFAVYCQQFGRALRTMPGKLKAIIIDHVGNVAFHKLPDAPRIWTLDRRESVSRGKSNGGIPLRICLALWCRQPYEAYRDCCPYCGTVPVPRGRSSPEQVEGNLIELTPEMLAAMRGEVIRVDSPPIIPLGASAETAGAVRRRHYERQVAQKALRDVMMLWGGYMKLCDRSDTESQRIFWFTFGIDVISAQALSAREAEELMYRIQAELITAGVNCVAA